MHEPALDLAAAFGGRTVLLTGHTGFKGAWLALWLTRLGASVVGFARPPATAPSLFDEAAVAEVLSAHHLGDVRDAEPLAEVVRVTQPDAVLHLAAQPLVLASYERPVETIATNVVGTANVLEAVRRARRSCAVVVVTSDKCYENLDQVWGYREVDRLGGGDPYSASKAAAELVTAAFRRSFFPPATAAEHGVLVASARSGNVIGGGDWSPDRLVPDAIRAVESRTVLGVRNPHQVRPWQHVLEPLFGYLLLTARLLAGDVSCCGPWNFGPRPGDEASVHVLVEEVLRAYGAGEWADTGEGTRRPEARQLRLAIDRAIADLGWAPRWDRREAVRRTVAWYRARADGFDPRVACLDDIAGYEAALAGGG
ncbi:MAG: CDP-glucose 4,6-dehydratase [Actinomycetota bacterium]|nr:CDP-glucose 4,6-dehydratase [Actinomycetota bacterium]